MIQLRKQLVEQEKKLKYAKQKTKENINMVLKRKKIELSSEHSLTLSLIH